MKINLQKLAAIEERVRQKWVVMDDIDKRLKDERNEWNRQKGIFLNQLLETPYCATLAEALEKNFDPKVVKDHQFESSFTYRINEINAQKAEVDRLSVEHCVAKEIWQAANACKNVLRDFAAKYGKSSASRVTVLGGEPAKPAVNIFQGG